MTGNGQDLSGMIDETIQDNRIAALVMRQYLKPVEGDNAVIFPPTYKGSDNKGSYNIVKLDAFEQNPKIHNVCVIDSVGSQANRMEPLFKTPLYAGLVPHIIVKVMKQAVKDQEKGALVEEIDLLDVGHRIADAVVRFSSGADGIREAFRSIQKDATKMAELAPTSLIFGCWDSRESQVKLPRIIRSTIRAYNVHPLNRAAQYFAPVKHYEEAGVEKAQMDKKEGKTKKGSTLGFYDNPSSDEGIGGVLLDSSSQIIRDTVLSLSALRALRSESDENTEKLRRYLFGLSLVAVTAPQSPLLRMGCELTLDPKAPVQVEIVGCDGSRQPFDLSPEGALQFAMDAAEKFGVKKEPQVFTFDPKKANEKLKELTKEEES